MSYLELKAGIPNFSKAIISFWFRAPVETLEAAYNAWVGPNPHPLFNGITPLMVFGDNTVKGYTTSTGDVVTQTVASEIWTQNLDGNFYVRDDSTPGTTTTGYQTYVRGTDIPFEPCYIGIDSNRSRIENYHPEDGGEPPSRNVLRVTLRMTSKPTGSGILAIKASSSFNGDRIVYQQMSSDSTGPGRGGGSVGSFGPDSTGHFTSGVDGYNPFITTNDFEDKTAIYLASTRETFTIKLDSHEVTPDHWHHVLLSFDLSKKVGSVGAQLPDKITNPSTVPDHGSISSGCTAWIAFDDVNYKGMAMRDKEQFNAYVTERLTFNDNGLYTPNAITAALTRTAANGSIDVAGAGIMTTTIDTGFSLPTYNYDPKEIVSKGYPVGIPAASKHVNSVRRVEMAEFQMWTDTTLDTSKEKNRRAFITSKGKPAKPFEAAELIGRKPDVMLHGSGKWVHGLNTGSTGIGKDGKKIEQGQFDVIAKIKRWRPDPSLHGAQKPAEKVTP